MQLEIFQTLYDMQAVAEFQREVLEAIGDADLETRDRIIRTSRKEALFAQLLTSIDLKFDPDRGEDLSIHRGMGGSAPVILDGRPFTFHNHEYLRLPMRTVTPTRWR